MTSNDRRHELLLELLRAGLERVDGHRCVREALVARPLQAPMAPVWAVAIGKAACAMALGAYDSLGTSLERVLIVTKSGHATPEAAGLPGVEIHESAHPLPDERSLAAGQRLLEWIDALPAGVTPLFLISGGASSLVEVLAPGVSLADLEQLSARGLAEGIPIGELNTRRAGLSRIKGGRLAARLAGRIARALFVSDVLGDDPAVIGSGLLGPPPQGRDRVEREVVASVDLAMEAVVAAAQGRRLSVRRASERFAGDAAQLASRFTHELLAGASQVCVWGGESTVRLPLRPGRGGRNQHLALAAARLLAGHPELLLLSVGTDGSDGPTQEAGALVDARTCERIAIAGLDPEDSLRRADSGTALAAADALVRTGPTGTNVADLVIGLRLPQNWPAA